MILFAAKYSHELFTARYNYIIIIMEGVWIIVAKIIKIVDDVVSIGTDDGKIKEVRSVDINFVPEVGDVVEIFENDGNIIVTKKENNILGEIYDLRVRRKNRKRSDRKSRPGIGIGARPV